MKKIKNFFIWLAIAISTFFEMLFIVLFSLFKKSFWKKLFNRTPKSFNINSILENEMENSRPIIPDFNKTFTVIITNKNKFIKKNEDDIDEGVQVTLFGANRNLLKERFGFPENVEVNVGESSYGEMMLETIGSPFVVSGFRVTTGNATLNQLDEVLTIEKVNASGSRVSFPLQISNYFSALQFQAGIREVYPYRITVTGRTQISLRVFSDTTVVFIFFVGKQVNIVDLLKDIKMDSPKLPFQRQSLSISNSNIPSAFSSI